MTISEVSAQPAYHIIKKNAAYQVYSPSLVFKGNFVRENDAFRCISNMNKDTRLPVYVQDSRGVVIKVLHASKVERLSFTDTEKNKVLRRKKQRKLYAKKSVHKLPVR